VAVLGNQTYNMIASAIEKEEKSKKKEIINLLRATSGNISFSYDCSINNIEIQLVLSRFYQRAVLLKLCVLMAQPWF
jgi:uncharacterized beta-barrel protein YwiB (DUF1934 family)